MTIKRIFSVRFEEDVVKGVTKRDGFYSIIYFVYVLVILYIFGLILFKTNLYDYLGNDFKNQSLFQLLFYMPDAIITLTPIFIILKVRKQSIKSIGLKKEKWLKSVVIGLVASIPFLIANVSGAISEGKTLNTNWAEVICLFLYFLLCISLTEEVAFRGFIQTRIQGLIKNKWVSILTVGLLFGLSHIPFQMINANKSAIDFIIYDWSHLLTTCVIHIGLVYLYTRDHNIIAPTIAHALMDFSYYVFE